MAGTQQASLARFAAADLQIERIARCTSNKSELILTPITKGWFTTTENGRGGELMLREGGSPSGEFNLAAAFPMRGLVAGRC